nr:MAG TPA: hypothetical protein [Caudoviricetes sp.]
MNCYMSPYRVDYLFILLLGAMHFHSLECTSFRNSRYTFLLIHSFF